MQWRLIFIGFLLCAAGCANLDLARFAPPGLVKYEEIAGDQPPNPEIEKLVAARKEEPNVKFPILSQTPGAADQPKIPSQQVVDAQSQELNAARDAVQLAADNDRKSVEADKSGIDALRDERDALKRRVDQDAIDAADERAEILVAPQNE
ncbi:MAG: hypothetical protein AAGC77_10830 [Pseudomonadota bacterium]